MHVVAAIVTAVIITVVVIIVDSVRSSKARKLSPSLHNLEPILLNPVKSKSLELSYIASQYAL